MAEGAERLPDVPSSPTCPRAVLDGRDDSQSYHDAPARAGAATDQCAGRRLQKWDPASCSPTGTTGPPRRASWPWLPVGPARSMCSLPASSLPNGFVDNVLANAQGPSVGENSSASQTGIHRGRRRSRPRWPRADVGGRRAASAVSRGAVFPGPIAGCRLSPRHGQCGCPIASSGRCHRQGESQKVGLKGELTPRHQSPAPRCADASSSLLCASAMATNDRALRARAAAIIPGGVSSPVRAFRAVGGTALHRPGRRGLYLRRRRAPL